MGRKMRTSQRRKSGLDIRKNFLMFDGHELCGHFELLTLRGRRLIRLVHCLAGNL